MQSGRNGANTYYVTKGTQIVRPSKNNSNFGPEASRTPAQQIRRIMWANIVNLYKVSGFWMPRAFENVKDGQTDYNIFMGLNMDKTLVALTKQEAEVGACVVEDVRVSLGSLPAISHIKSNETIATSIRVGGDVSTESTVAEFSAALIKNNPQVYEGMQLSFLYYLQSLDVDNTPRVQCFAYEMTLDTTDDSRQFKDLFPDSLVGIASGNIVALLSGVQGACCFIWSETTKRGKIRVSSQSLVSNNDYLITIYGSNTQYQKAMESYGVGVGVFLQSGYYTRAGGRPVIEVLLETYLMVPYEYKVGEVGPTYNEIIGTGAMQGLGSSRELPVGRYNVELEFILPAPSVETKKMVVTGTVQAGEIQKFVQLSDFDEDHSFNGLHLSRATFKVGTVEYIGFWTRD